MMKEYVARPQDFKRRILKVGAKKEMAVLERQLLQKRKKHLGERYYNLMIPAILNNINGYVMILRRDIKPEYHIVIW